MTVLYWFLLQNNVNVNNVSYVCTYILSLLNLSPTAPIPSLYVITEHPDEVSMLGSSLPLTIYFTHGSVCMSVPTHPMLSSLLYVHKSILYVCISIPALQTRSPAPFFLEAIDKYQYMIFFLFLTCFTLYDKL